MPPPPKCFSSAFLSAKCEMSFDDKTEYLPYLQGSFVPNIQFFFKLHFIIKIFKPNKKLNFSAGARAFTI